MQSQKKHRKCFSFEFFPPNTAEGAQKLAETAKQLAQLKPEFFSVTYGAGGSTRERTLQAVLDLCKAGHAAAPHEGVDPIVAGAAIVGALQTIASRVVNPTQGIVVSVTQFHAGETAINAIPGTAMLRGTARSFDKDAETSVPAMIKRQSACD